MTRAVLTLSGLAALGALACGGEPASAGPAYTPALANALKALTPSCELRTTEHGELRTCKGRQAEMSLELDRGRRLRSLELVVVTSTGVSEAWALLSGVLPSVVGQTASYAAEAALRNSASADSSGGDSSSGGGSSGAEQTADGIRIVATVDGQRHRVKLTWGT